MFHGVRHRAGPKRRQPAVEFAGALSLAFGLGLVLGACGAGSGTQLESTRFGQLGEIRVTVITPLIVLRGSELTAEGEFQQVLTWTAQGPWQVYEVVSHRGLVGDETLVRSQGDPSTFAAAYASLITQINETPELKLFVEGLDQGLEVDCLADAIESRSKVIFQVRGRWPMR